MVLGVPSLGVGETMKRGSGREGGRGRHYGLRVKRHGPEGWPIGVKSSSDETTVNNNLGLLMKNKI